MDPQVGFELPQHGLLFQRSQRSRIRRPDLGRPAGAVGAPRAVQPIQVGAPRPLGATPTRQGVNFALFSSQATRVELCIFDADSAAETARYDLPGRTGDVWHGLLSPRRASAGTRYAYRVHGANTPDSGGRFDPGITLLDPYARALSIEQPLRSRVSDPTFDWEGDRPPGTPWRETVIYE